MADGNLPDVEILRKLLAYDPETGILTWKPRPAEMFSAGNQGAEANAAAWSARYAGKSAFTALDSHGYRHGDIFGRKHRAHRVAWAIFYGEWPSDQIDHKNGDRSDNRIENMRDATISENAKNRKRRSTNTSGVMGVYWHKRGRKWRAHIRVSGRHEHLGVFTDFAEAVAARNAAEAKYGFHENNGRE